ncbi:MAG: ABC transporter ATP-binding protein [Castellaniella sp.]|uniref:ABC transporter ATP-binding protein n=1 Tax=Castellaniella sp. TaxID=1955812 RepID=UPI0011FDA1A2|nr:ABC transporter ATP-binding protein [Castellaniella sp.]TAN27111.1 MAG: ABC transporter ATP-binding protein [Castellaniella sp.]
MSQPMHVKNLKKSYGAFKAVDNVSLDISAGSFHALIGPNGAGKSTLVGLLAGELLPDHGTIAYGDTDVTHTPVNERVRAGLFRSYQITSVIDEFTVLENVLFAAMAAREHCFRFWRPLTSQRHLMPFAEPALQKTHLYHLANATTHDISYGERRQLELAMAIAAGPQFLLLDEPMAGMSAAESTNVAQLLQSLKGEFTMVLVEHDMEAVFSLADTITVLESGRVAASGTPQEIRKNPQVLALYLGNGSDTP